MSANVVATVVHFVLLAFFLVAPVAAQPAAASPQDANDIVFVFPNDASPAKRTGGATRNPGNKPSVTLFAPADKLGQTSREQPVLYWHLSKPTESPVTFVVNNRVKSTSSPKITLPGPHAKGLHKFDLAVEARKAVVDVKLERDTEYEVIVEVVVDPDNAASNPRSGARIKRVARDVVLDKGADPFAMALLCRKELLWFDYLDAMRTALARNDANRVWAKAYRDTLAAQGLLVGPDGAISGAPRTAPAGDQK